MPANFALCFGFVLSHEDPELTGETTVDSGGSTRYGISSNSFPKLWEGTKPSLDILPDFMKSNFGWADISHMDSIIASKILDMRYDIGAIEANKIIQTSFNVKSDGVFGPATNYALGKSNNAISILCLAQLRFYESLKDFSDYPGWKARALDHL